MATTDVVKKKAAPELIIGSASMRDERTAIVEELDKGNKSYVHAFQSEAIASMPSELERRAQEVVKVGDKVLKVGGDVVVRIPRDRYEATRQYQEEKSFEGIQQIAERPDEVRQEPKAKAPAPRREKRE